MGTLGCNDLDIFVTNGASQTENECKIKFYAIVLKHFVLVFLAFCAYLTSKLAKTANLSQENVFCKKSIWVRFINAKFDANFESIEKLLKCSPQKIYMLLHTAIKV